MTKQKRQALFLAMPIMLALLTFFVSPMVYVLVDTMKDNGTKYFVKFFTDDMYIGILKTTISVSLKTTVISLLLGYPTAYFLARTGSKIKNVLMIAILFPFLVSSVVRSYGWMVILGT